MLSNRKVFHRFVVGVEFALVGSLSTSHYKQYIEPFYVLFFSTLFGRFSLLLVGDFLHLILLLHRAMLPELTAPKQPIAIRTEHIVDKPTSFRVQQHGKGLSSGKFTVFRPKSEVALQKNGKDPGELSSTAQEKEQEQEPETLMYVEGKYTSLEEKRAFRDASGLPLFELYHRAIGVTWYVELPGRNGAPIVCIKPRFSMLKDNLDVQIQNAADDGQEVTLHVQGQDIWKQRTNVYLGDNVVMTAKRTDKLAVYLPGKKLEWDVDIAAGIDVSLASVIMVVLAANMYNSSMKASSSS